MDADRPLPHNLDAERAVLGAVLLDNDALKTASELLAASDLFLPEHRVIFTRMLALATAGVGVDLITLTDALAQHGEIERAGGIGYAAQLVDGVPRVSHVEHYCQIVKENATLRGWARFGAELEEKALEQCADATCLAQWTSESVARLGREAARGTKHQIRAWEDIPRLGDIPVGRVEWLVDGLVARGVVVLLAGEAGVYKTWLSQRLAKGVAEGGQFLGRRCERSDVLYLDRENPPAVVRERAEILGLADTEHLRIWGGWLADQAPALGDARLLEIAKARRPLIILDSLIRFHSADENSATEMAKAMAALRGLANAGATVLAQHHRAKSETSQYRGSSDILAGVDVAFSLHRDRQAGLLRLECFKNRLGPEFSLTVRPDLEESGDFIVTDAPAVSAEREQVERLAAVIREEPGLPQKAVIERSRVAQKRAAQLLKSHEGELWRSEPGPHRSTLYYPCVVVSDVVETTI